MTNEEFEEWYKKKRKVYKEGKSWLTYKARYFISNTSLDYSNIEELISLTIVDILENLEDIKLETADSYAFFTMKKAMYNKIIYPKRQECCEGDFSEYNTEIKEYDVEEDKNQEKLLKSIEDKVKSEKELLIYTSILEGKPISRIGIPSRDVANIKRKFAGVELLNRKSYKKKNTGNPKGRPKLNKKKEKEMRIYKGVAKISDDGTIKYYQSAQATMIEGFSRESVSKCCNGKLHKHKGFQFKWVKDIITENKSVNVSSI